MQKLASPVNDRTDRNASKKPWTPPRLERIAVTDPLMERLEHRDPQFAAAIRKKGEGAT